MQYSTHTLRTLFLCFLLTFLGRFSLAQDLSYHVPGDAQMVFSFKGGELFKKVDPERILAMPLVKDMQGRPGFDFDILTKPESYGVDLYQSFHYFMGSNPEITYQGMLIPLKSENTFGDFAATQLPDTNVIEGDGFQYRIEGSQFYGWNNRFAIILNGTLNYMNPSVFEADYEERGEMESSMTYQQGTNIFNLDTWNSLGEDALFQKEYAKRGDFFLWTNAGSSLNAFDNPTMGYSPMGGMLRYLNDLYKGNYSTLQLSFEEGALVGEGTGYWNDQLADLVNGTYDTKLDKNFLKYISGDDLMMYASFGMNSENFWKQTKEVMTPIMDSLPRVEGGFFSSSLDVLDIFIDEEAIYELLPGNAMFVMSGIQTIEVEQITYEYDDDFNRTEVKTTNEEDIPEFTLMLSTGNETNARKILNALTKIPETILIAEGSHYVIPELKEELGVDFYITVSDGIIFFTNHQELVNQRLGTGFPAAQRLSKTHLKTLKKNNQVIYCNLAQMTELVPVEARSQNPQINSATELTANTFDEFWSVGANRKNLASSQLRLSFKKENESAIDQLIDFINELYLQTQNN